MARHNPQKICGHLSYTVDELAEALNITGKTCLRWVGQGLKTVPGSNKPILVMGSDAKEFIRTLNSKNKVKLERHEFYCFRCKAPRRAKRGTIGQSGDTKRGRCSVCNAKMTRKIKPSQKDYHIPPPAVQMSLFVNNLNSQQNDKSKL